MNVRLLAAAAVLGFFTSPVPAADPQLTGLVMPGAKVLAGVNVEQAKASPFGQYVLARLQQNEQGLQQLLDATGFDPRRDVREVLVASLDNPASRTGGLAMVLGTFDVTRIAAAAQTHGQTVETAGGVTFLSGSKKNGAVAFLSSSLAVAGPADEVRAAVDRRNSPAPLDTALAVKMNQLSTTQDAWIVSLVPPSVSAARLPDPTLQGLLNSDLLAGIQQSSAAVKFGVNVDVTAEALAASPQDASALATIIRFLAGMAQSNSQGTTAASLLKGLSVTTEGNAVRLALSIPEDMLEQLAQPHAASGASARHRR